MDAAGAAHPDLRIQRVAARLLGPAGAAHGYLMAVDAFGECRRHQATQLGFGFRPVQADAVGGAAGAAGEAGMGHGKRANETRAAFYPAGAVALPLRATIRG